MIGLAVLGPLCLESKRAEFVERLGTAWLDAWEVLGDGDARSPGPAGAGRASVMSTRDQVLRSFRRALDGRPVVWASERTSLGDYEGHEVTLEIFDVPAEEQRDLRGRLRPQREEAARALGGRVQIVFHTPDATTRHYSWVRAEDATLDLRPPASRGSADGRRDGTHAAHVDSPPLLTPRGPLRTSREAA